MRIIVTQSEVCSDIQQRFKVEQCDILLVHFDATDRSNAFREQTRFWEEGREMPVRNPADIAQYTKTLGGDIHTSYMYKHYFKHAAGQLNDELCDQGCSSTITQEIR